MIRRSRRRPGFTLLELLVTLAILGVLASMVLPVAQLAVQRAQEQELRRALRDIRNALDAYKKAGDDGRIARAEGASGYPPNLEVLASGVPDQRDPKGAKIYFLRRVPPDPLAAMQDGAQAPVWGKRSYASEAADPQEGVDVYDVYSTAPGVGLTGTPYRDW